MSSPSTRNHVAIANQYIADVLSGKIDACAHVKAACQRQVDDLAGLAGYRFDENLAGRVCRFIEMLPHIKGALAGQNITLEPWQCFLLTTAYGWVKDGGPNDGKRRFRRAYVEVPRGNGKALAIDTLIPTTSGIKKMGDLCVGDKVFGTDGKPTKIVAATDVMHGRPCYEMEFSTGEIIVSDENHLWVTDSRRDRDRKKGRGGKNYGECPSIKTTKEISESVRCRKDANHRIKTTAIIGGRKKKYIIHPYVLGAWLGDGTSSGSGFTSGTQEIPELISGFGEVVNKKKSKYGYSLSDGNKSKPHSTVTFLSRLRALGLIRNKHIPEIYFHGSFKQRLDLLRGLMDTDGSISKRQGQCEITQKNKILALQIKRLAASLGLRPTIESKTALCSGKDCGLVYRVKFHAYSDMPVFYLKRKRARLRKRPKKRGLQNFRQIIRCEKTQSVPVRCIQVEAADGCFLATESNIVTHNSAILSGLTLYALAADGEGGPEVYSAATTRDQAGIVFKDSQNMLRMRPQLMQRLKVSVNAHAIVGKQNGGFYRSLSSQSNSLDGLNLHFGCLDELHAHKGREIYDVLETALGKRVQSFLWSITTAGSNRSGICYEVRDYVVKILKKLVHDDSVFGIIYTVDETDQWTEEKSWIKANPNWGVSVQPDVIGQLAAKAMQMPSAVNNFLTKHLDVWVSADASWMDMRHWEACTDTSLCEESFYGEDCVIGLDLASKVDIAAKVKVFRRFIDGVAHYYLFGSYYLPEQAIVEQKNSQYSGWERMDLLRVTAGDVVDIDQIEVDIKAEASDFSVRDVAYDPFQATQLSNRLAADGFNMVEVRPTVLNFSEPMKEIDVLVRQRRLHHNGDPVMAWMVSNVVCHTDAKDNIYPRKERPENKIDGVVALIMAIARWTVGDDEATLSEILSNPLSAKL